MRNINIICKKILQLSEEELSKADEIIKEQLDYIHPLKMATANKFHKLGEYNSKVLQKIKELLNILKNPPLKEP